MRVEFRATTLRCERAARVHCSAHGSEDLSFFYRRTHARARCSWRDRHALLRRKMYGYNFYHFTPKPANFYATSTLSPCRMRPAYDRADSWTSTRIQVGERSSGCRAATCAPTTSTSPRLDKFHETFTLPAASTNFRFNFMKSWPGSMHHRQPALSEEI